MIERTLYQAEKYLVKVLDLKSTGDTSNNLRCKDYTLKEKSLNKLCVLC